MRSGLGHLAARSAFNTQDVPLESDLIASDFFPRRRKLGGLAALVAHSANQRTTSNGGTLGIEGMGGGSGSGDTTGQALAPTISPSPGSSYGLHPTGRNTYFLERGRRQYRYQPNMQGARVGAGDRAELFQPRESDTPAFPTGGLFGLSGLDGFFSWIKQRVTPPSGGISKIQIIPPAIRNIIPTPVRTAIRYAGAGVQSLVLPVLSGPEQRQVFGLSPSESGVFMKMQQVMRPIDAALLTWGVAGVVAPLLATPASISAAAAPAALPGTVSAGELAAGGSASLDLVSTVPSASALGFATPAAASLPAGYATPAMFASSVAAGSSAAAPLASTSLDLALPATMPSPIAAPVSLPQGYATAAQIAGQAAPAASSPMGAAGPGFWSKAGEYALSGAKEVGKTVLTSAATIAVARALTPGGAAGDQGQPQTLQVGGGAGGAQPQVAPQVAPQSAMPYYASGGDVGTTDAGMLPGVSLTSYLPIVGVGAVLIYALFGGRKKPQRRSA